MRKFIFIIVMLLLLISCNNSLNTDEFIPLGIDSNQTQHYCMIGDKHYFDLNVMSENGTMNKIAENIPYGNPFSSEIFGIATDGEYLYCHAYNLQIKEDTADELKSGLYKIDVENNIITPLHEWDTPKYRSNNYSIKFREDYVYFFKSNNYESNDVCRVKKDGTEFEQLTDNKESTYSGLFFAGDRVYYHRNSNLYKTTLDNLENGELFYEDLYSIELYNGYFYCLENKTNTFIEIKENDTSSMRVLFADMYNDCYIRNGDTIYYAKHDPVNLGKGTQNIDIINETQGCIYSYNLITDENEFYFQNSEINFINLLNINSNSILARVYTNTQYLTQEGLNIDYYIIPLDGSEAHHIKDLTSYGR